MRLTAECLVRGQAGSSSVLLLGLLAGMVTLGAVVTGAGKMAMAQGALGSATDLAAIVGSQTLRGLNTGFPCQRVQQILQANMAHLKTCSIVGDEVTVATTTRVVGIVLNATATAAGN